MAAPVSRREVDRGIRHQLEFLYSKMTNNKCRDSHFGQRTVVFPFPLQQGYSGLGIAPGFPNSGKIFGYPGSHVDVLMSIQIGYPGSHVDLDGTKPGTRSSISLLTFGVPFQIMSSLFDDSATPQEESEEFSHTPLHVIPFCQITIDGIGEGEIRTVMLQKLCRRYAAEILQSKLFVVGHSTPSTHKSCDLGILKAEC
ncbi:uncharacterized protein TRIADDRAFT_55326 [Trichoplax adhaerens]|uniref:Uncharacterized protein n=1 Tax=Trichoplax adhaerens TaxID=10228 RepID=B3RUK7_TRIAD|nr:predicted protein [Trichoplax adhaerens]EDV25834.1 predicted protein [Trichoplax adhaerens]|eukprot:XP_002111867.1 predicted protein [Trichoplax adhaerens]